MNAFKTTCTVCIIWLLAASVNRLQAQPLQLENFSMGGPKSSEFTSNSFKCIGVGKGGIVWAGTQYGGLYRYIDSLKTWKKSYRLTNVFINDIKMDPDSGIWIGQSGTQSAGGNSNIAGGVNYFKESTDSVMSFYSVAGTTTSADLISRNVRSLYLDPNFKASTGHLPRVWAAQGSYITSFNSMKGGISAGLRNAPPYFLNVPGGFSPLANVAPYVECIGGNGIEIWAGTRLNNGVQILRYKPSGLFIDSFTSHRVSKLPNNFIANAIYFDNVGNKWIGLRAGGLVILSDTGWIRMNDPSLFPAGAVVNINAITGDKYGNVYIGTSNGLIEYKSKDFNPLSDPGFVPSYKLYTTSNGLPNNNITGLGFDGNRQRLLLTTDAGVTFIDKYEPYIRGVVFDVAADLFREGRQNSGFKKIPLSGGVGVRLLRNGIEEEFTTPDASGIFELKKANEKDLYTVEIVYDYDNTRTFRYQYRDIRNHTLMEPVLIPYSLIQEIDSYKEKMARRCFQATLSLGIQVSPDFLCTDAFNVNIYETAYSYFFNTGGITADHKKRVDNLANYYTSLATVYQLGGQATELVTDAVVSLFDAVESLRGFVEFGVSLKKPGNADPLEQIGEEALAGAVAAIKVLKDGLVITLGKTAPYIKDPKTQELFNKVVGGFNEVADVAIEVLENGRGQGVIKVILDNLKKILAAGVAMDYYEQDFAQGRHGSFIQRVSLNAYSNLSPYTFEEGYNQLYDPGAPSLAKFGNDTLKNRKQTIATLNDYAKYADMASNALDAATALALIPGGQVVAAWAKGLSFAAKGIKTAALSAAIYHGAVGAGEVADISDSVYVASGLKQRPALKAADFIGAPLNAQDTLVARKERYNQRLAELQTIYNAGTFDATAYRNKRRQLRIDDSLYSAALSQAVFALLSTADSAIVKVPGFTNRINRVVDSFVAHQYNLRQSLYFQNIAFVYATTKSAYAPGLDSLTKELAITNDSAVNGLVHLMALVSSSNILSPAYLVQEGYSINHSRAPGSTGSVTYRFKNYGAVAMQNVRFKISKPTAGYSITSADSVYIGPILPGETKQISFSFQAPMHDSMSNYTIKVMAANGIYNDVYGVLYVLDPTVCYSIKDGNWNDPATWSTNTVPGAVNKVYISHAVTVTTDVTCKMVSVDKPGNVIVNTNRRITIVP
ncbi:MAG TPA: hypothetical protein PKC39_07750 [Ferruginibacter sp.]|nr:hypothetical protein [Ferruginibacter sp.]HMP20838.1 hypothetical protein [Ferruginibacter sp.]